MQNKPKFIKFMVIVIILIVIGSLATVLFMRNKYGGKRCPQWSPAAPGWCSDGKIINPKKNFITGCYGHPTCER